MINNNAFFFIKFLKTNEKIIIIKSMSNFKLIKKLLIILVNNFTVVKTISKN